MSNISHRFNAPMHFNELSQLSRLTNEAYHTSPGKGPLIMINKDGHLHRSQQHPANRTIYHSASGKDLFRSFLSEQPGAGAGHRTALQAPGSFNTVWKKAISKYSPKKNVKLNEVSERF